MPQGARVDSLDALTLFKSALIKFQEAAQIALSDAEGEMNRVLLWVETEQQSHWQNQIRKCQEAVVKCKEAVRMKKIFKDASGRQQSAVDEEKALTLAVKRLAEAEGKLAAVKRWSRQLQREIGMYKGGVQRFVTTVETEIPHAAAHLEGLMAKLDAYLSVQPAAIGDLVGAESSGSALPSMARGGWRPPARTTRPLTRFRASHRNSARRWRQWNRPPRHRMRTYPRLSPSRPRGLNN